MKIRFVGERPRDVSAPGRSFTAQPGGEYEVPDQLGAAMCEQKWFEPVDPPVQPAAPEPAEEKPARASRKESTR
jgi:hypothetical protein